MIVKITPDNMSEYITLFEAANNELGLKPGDARYIEDVESYFANLYNLVYKDENNPSLQYTKIPVDEEHFTIDANSRKITIPPNFLSHGLAVQGDNSAEIVWFEIDRFYDIVDFNNTVPCVQWRRQGEEEIHQSTAWYPNINKPNKYIFGWPIDEEIAKKPGTIEFSVRFLGINIDKNILEYNFNTLPASLIINHSLNMTDINLNGDNSVNNIIKSRIKNSVLGNNTYPLPPMYIVKNKSGYVEDQNGKLKSFLEIDADHSGIQEINLGANGTKKEIYGMAYSTASKKYKTNKSQSLSFKEEDAIVQEFPLQSITVFLPILKDNENNFSVINTDKNFRCYKNATDDTPIQLNTKLSLGDGYSIVTYEDKEYLEVIVKGTDYVKLSLDGPGYYKIITENILADIQDSNSKETVSGEDMSKVLPDHIYKSSSQILQVPAPSPINVIGYRNYLGNEINMVNNECYYYLLEDEAKDVLSGIFSSSNIENTDLKYYWTRQGDTGSLETDINQFNASVDKMGIYNLQVVNRYNSGEASGEIGNNLIITKKLETISSDDIIIEPSDDIVNETKSFVLNLCLADEKFKELNEVPSWVKASLFGSKVIVNYYISDRYVGDSFSPELKVYFTKLETPTEIELKNVNSFTLDKNNGKIFMKIPISSQDTYPDFYKDYYESLGFKNFCAEIIVIDLNQDEDQRFYKCIQRMEKV